MIFYVKTESNMLNNQAVTATKSWCAKSFDKKKEKRNVHTKLYNLKMSRKKMSKSMNNEVYI